MKWGRTHAEIVAGFHKEWRPRFALWPTVLEDGRTAWLETVERRRFDDTCANWAGDSSRWIYRALNGATL